MKSREKPRHQQDMFLQDFEHMLDPRQPLCRLADRLPWERFESQFEGFYEDRGRPAKPIRLMVGLLLLKQLENLSDERVCAAWQRDPYMQYFCGESHFQWTLPCEPSDLVYFRRRIGEEGVRGILEASVELHAGQVQQEEELVADTTVQEANITYPTDVKLRRKVIERLWKMGAEADIRWDHSYVRTVPKLLRLLRTRSNRTRKARRKAERRLKTLAGRLLREFRRKASGGWQLVYSEELEVMEQVLRQQRNDKGKAYSLHDPTVQCIAKGKAHKKYVPRSRRRRHASEAKPFGRKASVTMLRDSGVIVGAMSFENNPYDGDTLSDALWQVKVNTGKEFASCLVDQGYAGRARVLSTEIVQPYRRATGKSYYAKQKQRKRFARRSAIEPVIGHLKSDFRMARCFLKGAFGASQFRARMCDIFHLMLAAAAWNMKKWIRETLLRWFQTLLRIAYRTFQPIQQFA